VITHYLTTMQGALQPTVVDALLNGLGAPPDQPLGDLARPEVMRRVARLAAIAALAPAFQSA